VAFSGTTPSQTPAAAGLIAPTISGLDVRGGIKNDGSSSNGQLNILDDLLVGSLTQTNNLVVSGKIVSGGDIVSSKKLSSTGDTNVGGYLNVGYRIYSGLDTNVGSNLSVGVQMVNGILDSVNGPTSIGGGALEVRGPITNNGAANGGSVKIDDNLNVAGTLDVSKNTTLNGNILTLGNTSDAFKGGELNFVGANTAIKAIKYILGLNGTLSLQASADPSTVKVFLKQGTNSSMDGVGIYGNLHGASDAGGINSLNITGKVNAPNSDFTAANLTARGTVKANTLTATNTVNTWDLNLQNNAYGWAGTAFFKAFQAGDDSTGVVDSGMMSVKTNGDIAANDYSKAGLTIGTTNGPTMAFDHDDINTFGGGLYFNYYTGQPVYVGASSKNANLTVYGKVTANGFGTYSSVAASPITTILPGGYQTSSASCGSLQLISCGNTNTDSFVSISQINPWGSTCTVSAKNNSPNLSSSLTAKAICLDTKN
jgi:hypothetical protein